MALKSLSSYVSLPSPEITFAKIINTCVCMCGVQGFIYVGLYVSGCKCGGLQIWRSVYTWVWKSV